MGKLADADVDLGGDADVTRIWFTTLAAWLTQRILSGQKITFDAFIDAVDRLTSERKSAGEKSPEQPSPSNPENQADA